MCDTSTLMRANDDLPCAMDAPVCSHPSYCASLETVRDAHVRIRDHIHRTPVFTSSQLDRLTGCQLFFKCENLQKTGAFKYRGACNAVMQLTADEAAHGVVTHSSGNHAAALALAAKVRGIPAFIVLPRDTPAVKVEAIQGYGGRITLCDPGMDNREAACAQLQAQTGAVFIPPYNHAGIISGQGTLALELLEQVPDLDAVVVPVSGGGMISGVAVAVRGLQPRMKVIAAEPCGLQGTAADVAQCKAAGQLVPCEMPHTIADGLRGRLGDLTWPIVRDCVDVCVPVSESDIVTAMRLVFERLKLVVEPSGAAGLAAVLRWTQAARDSPSGSDWSELANCKRVGIILCGGNVDLAAKGLWEQWGA
ncbi:serine/threonine dehydratase [Haematococcus lacustris]